MRPFEDIERVFEEEKRFGHSQVENHLLSLATSQPERLELLARECDNPWVRFISIDLLFQHYSESASTRTLLLDMLMDIGSWGEMESCIALDVCPFILKLTPSLNSVEKTLAGKNLTVLVVKEINRELSTNEPLYSLIANIISSLEIEFEFFIELKSKIELLKSEPEYWIEVFLDAAEQHKNPSCFGDLFDHLIVSQIDSVGFETRVALAKYYIQTTEFIESSPAQHCLDVGHPPDTITDHLLAYMKNEQDKMFLFSQFIALYVPFIHQQEWDEAQKRVSQRRSR